MGTWKLLFSLLSIIAQRNRSRKDLFAWAGSLNTPRKPSTAFMLSVLKMLGISDRMSVPQKT